MEQISITWRTTRLKLFALWLFVILNIIFRDIHQMTLKSHLEMLLTGYFNGIKITESIMLFGAFVVNIPISMLLVSLFARHKINRLLNIIYGALFPLLIITTPPTDMDDVFHLIVELAALVTIVITSIKWKH